jgi:hypothetical protein
MTAVVHSVGAVLLSLLVVPAALRGRAPASRGRGSSRWQTWPLGRGLSRRRGSSWRPGSSWRRRSRRPTRRSASLGGLPFDGRPARPPSATDQARSNPSGNAHPDPRPALPTRRSRAQTPWTPIGRALARLPRPGGAAAARREMEEAVPEVIDVLRATVGAGINPRRALQAAAEGAPSALEPVLAQAIRAAEFGSGTGSALAAAAKSEGLHELVLAGEALDLAETTGAPPGPVLSGVAAAAADRVRSRQARMAATAEARLSARVVAGMAPAFLGVLALTSPSDAAFLVREPLGWATLAAAAVLELLGISWATRIVRGPTP